MGEEIIKSIYIFAKVLQSLGLDKMSLECGSGRMVRSEMELKGKVDEQAGLRWFTGMFILSTTCPYIYIYIYIK